MRIIDAHVHLYPDAINARPAAWAAAAGEPHWATLCTRVRKDGRPVQGFPGVAGLLRAMDEAGVERAILQGWYWERHDTCVLQNRFYAECVRAHPDRLSACATLHPAAGWDAVRDEIGRGVDAGFVGLGELSPHSQGFAVDDAVWRRILALAGELRLPVNLHVTEPGGRSYPGKIETPPADFARMAGEHPGTTFVLAHWGARWSLRARAAAAEGDLANVYVDTAASMLIYPLAVFAEMTAAVGADRILFGSDFPLISFPRRETEPSIASFLDEIRGAGLSKDAVERIAGENARRVFGLS